MAWRVLIAHAPDEEHWAEALAGPLRAAGYEVSHLGTVLVGDSVVEEAALVLAGGGPVVLCGTVKAVGTRWARRLVHAARRHAGVRVLIVQIDEEADVESLAFGEKVAHYWRDPARALDDLLAALRRNYPLALAPASAPPPPTPEPLIRQDAGEAAEMRYRELALRAASVLDLAGLPETPDRLLPELRRLYVPLRVKTVIAGDAATRRTEMTEMESRRVSLGERLAAARRLVVLGEPGAGKSTLLRWLAAAYLLRLRSIRDWIGFPDVTTLPFEPFLPVIISSRDLDAGSLAGSLEDLLRFTLRKAELGEAETEALLPRLRTRLDEGRLLLLFDSLDAVGGLAARAGLVRQIEQISLAHPKTPIVVTSRPAGYRELGFRLGRGFEHVMIAELSREEKETFARLWYRLAEPRPERRQREVEELVRAVHSTNRIERLAGNPMLLATMALVMPKIGRIPQRRAELYWAAVDMLLQRGVGHGEALPPREALPRLEYLAWAMCDRGVQQLSEPEILALLEDFRGDGPTPLSAADFLRLVEGRTGILRRSGERRHLGMTVPVYEFRHLTFQEYLAARALVDGCFPGRDPDRTLAENVRPLAGRTVPGPDGEMAVSEHWREALRLCAACAGDGVGEVLLALLHPLPGESEATARPRAVLAALCLADEPEVDAATAREVLAGLAGQVRDREGSALWRTSLDHAVRELAESRWLPWLRLALVREFRARAAAERWSLGFLYMKLAALSELQAIDQESGPPPLPAPAPSAPAFDGPEEEAIAMGLEVVGSAFAAERLSARELAARLLPLLDGGPAATHAAAWALYSLLGRRRDEEAWQPSAAELERIARLVARPDLDPAAAWCLLKILDRGRG